MTEPKLKVGDKVSIEIPRLKEKVGIITEIRPKGIAHRYVVIYGDWGAFSGDELKKITGVEEGK